MMLLYSSFALLTYCKDKESAVFGHTLNKRNGLKRNALQKGLIFLSFIISKSYNKTLHIHPIQLKHIQ